MRAWENGLLMRDIKEIKNSIFDFILLIKYSLFNHQNTLISSLVILLNDLIKTI